MVSRDFLTFSILAEDYIFLQNQEKKILLLFFFNKVRFKPNSEFLSICIKLTTNRKEQKTPNLSITDKGHRKLWKKNTHTQKPRIL